MKKRKGEFTMAHVWSSLDDDAKFKKHVRAERQRAKQAAPKARP